MPQILCSLKSGRQVGQDQERVFSRADSALDQAKGKWVAYRRLDKLSVMTMEKMWFKEW